MAFPGTHLPAVLDPLLAHHRHLAAQGLKLRARLSKNALSSSGRLSSAGDAGFGKRKVPAPPRARSSAGAGPKANGPGGAMLRAALVGSACIWHRHPFTSARARGLAAPSLATPAPSPSRDSASPPYLLGARRFPCAPLGRRQFALEVLQPVRRAGLPGRHLALEVILEALDGRPVRLLRPPLLRPRTLQVR